MTGHVARTKYIICFQKIYRLLWCAVLIAMSKNTSDCGVDYVCVDSL